jgi:hypothetical protein
LFLACIKCGLAGDIVLNLNDLESFQCQECGTRFSAFEIQFVMNQWKKALDWIDAAPVKE